MSQRLPGDFDIDPDTVNGTDLADILNRMKDAGDSLHSGAARPSYAVRGTLWLDESGAPGGTVKIMFFDGTNDVEIGKVNIANSLFTAPGAIGRNILINGDSRVNQRGFDGNWAGLALNEYGYDRWQRDFSPLVGKAQRVEISNLQEHTTYVLSWEGGKECSIVDTDGNTYLPYSESPAVFTTATLTGARNYVSIRLEEANATNIKLELGSQPTPFQVTDYGAELAKCQRYYIKLPIGPIVATTANGNWAYSGMLLPVTMAPGGTLLSHEHTTVGTWVNVGFTVTNSSISLDAALSADAASNANYRSTNIKISAELA